MELDIYIYDEESRMGIERLMKLLFFFFLIKKRPSLKT